MNDQFILDSTEYGVGRWEKMLKTSPKPTDTLDERKFRILTILNRELPYTYRMLERMLTNLCGNDGFTIILRPNEYYISIRLALANESYYTDVKNMLERILPANMTNVVEIKYNTHKNLSRFTHRQLQPYSHEQLRKEVFEDGQQNA